MCQNLPAAAGIPKLIPNRLREGAVVRGYSQCSCTPARIISPTSPICCVVEIAQRGADDRVAADASTAWLAGAAGKGGRGKRGKNARQSRCIQRKGRAAHGGKPRGSRACQLHHLASMRQSLRVQYARLLRGCQSGRSAAARRSHPSTRDAAFSSACAACLMTHHLPWWEGSEVRLQLS